LTELFATTGDAVVRIAEDRGDWSAAMSLPGSRAQCLALDPTRDRTLYAGCRGNGVWRSADGGATWEDCRLPVPEVFSVAVSAADGAVYAGCEPSMLFRSRDGGGSWEELTALRSIPSAPAWSFPPRPWTSHVRWIAPSPHDALLLLVGIELGGVMRSDDGGLSWDDHRPGAQRDAHALAWHPRDAGRAYEAAGGGAAWSFDAGASWRPADEGRDRHYAWALAVDPDDPDRWYVSASMGPLEAHESGSAEAYVYRWQGQGPFEALAGGLPQPLDSMPYAMLARDGELYAGLGDGRLFASDDHGDTWNRLAVRGDPLPRILALTCPTSG
jgi:photosystem II stability/assembly factor-like uncharacterized protein